MKIYELTLDSKPILDKYLQYNTFPGCDLAPANPILWGKHYDTAYTIINDMLVFCKLQKSRPVVMSFPIGAGDVRTAFENIRDYFYNEGLPFQMHMVEPEMFSMIEHWYPGLYHVEYDRDVADYLYTTDSLASLSGKKLHGKRNHINRFLENYPGYVYERLSDNNVEDCLRLADDWARENLKDEEETRQEDKEYEMYALQMALQNREKLGLMGALIRVEGKTIAFTLGEQLTSDTFVVHFEKAYSDIQGAYPMINREFVRRELLGRYKYVNREEDMGIPGLRHAKTSYQPVRLVEKGFVTCIE